MRLWPQLLLSLPREGIVEADEERGQKTDRMLAEQARAGLRRDTGGSLETS